MLRMPRALAIPASTSPWRASEGAVRKKYPRSSIVLSAGVDAEGETRVTPLGTATLLATAMVTPEQSAPMIAATPSEVIRRSAAAVAAAVSMQVESPRTETTFLPPRNLPDREASDMASSAPEAMSGVSDSIGPVNPSRTPIFMSA